MEELFDYLHEDGQALIQQRKHERETGHGAHPHAARGQEHEHPRGRPPWLELRQCYGQASEQELHRRRLREPEQAVGFEPAQTAILGRRHVMRRAQLAPAHVPDTISFACMLSSRG